MRKLLVSAIAVLATVATAVGAAQSVALPIAPAPVAPVTGIPTPCPTLHPWPGDDVAVATVTDQFAETFKFKLSGSQWTSANRESIKILWETLDAVSCTGYVKDLQSKVSGTVGVNAARIGGFAWGDWSLTKTGYVTLDFSKFQRALDSGDEGRLVRLVIHEMGHVLTSDRYSNPDYWNDFERLFRSEGRFSDYARGSVTETFSDVVGYYVGRCALDNPYDSGKYDAYYAFARDRIFGGKEFGPAPGEKPNCVVPAHGAEAPQPGAEPSADTWVEAVAGE